MMSDTATEEHQDTEGTAGHAEDPGKYAEIEREAKELGWAPRDRWRGNQEDFIDAPEFLNKARQHLPVLRSLLDREKADRRRENAEYQARVADFERRLATQAKMTQRSLDWQKRALMEKFEEEKRSALAIEDPQLRQNAYTGAQRRERDAFHALATEEQREQEAQRPAQQQQQPVQLPPEIVQWGEKNPWTRYVPPHLMQEAVGIMGELERTDPTHTETTLTQKLDDVTKVMKRRHPSWFPPEGHIPRESREPAPREQQVSAVEGGRGIVRDRGNVRAKAFKDLPSEAKSEFNGLLRQGYLRPMKGEDETKARARLEKEYAATYWDEYGE